jgi:hypothetical protein
MKGGPANAILISGTVWIMMKAIHSTGEILYVGIGSDLINSISLLSRVSGTASRQAKVRFAVRGEGHGWPEKNRKTALPND